MKNLKDIILEKIKHGDAKQTPKWQFRMQEFLSWFGVGVMIALAALAFATVFFNFANADWMMRRQLGWSIGGFIFMNMPYIWLIILIGLISVSYYAFRQTKNGYQYALPFIAVIMILLSVVFGFASHHYLMSGRWIELGAQEHMPMYEMMTRPKQAVWQQPENGFLAGRVISPFLDNKFELSDINRKTWLVSCDECFMPLEVELEKNVGVKIIGKKIDEVNFVASEIRLMFGPRDIRMK